MCRGLGVFKEVDKTKAFYKLLPIEDTEEALEKYIAMDDYCKAFAVTEVAYITSSQHDRLQLSVPEEQLLWAEYNICERVEPSKHRRKRQQLDHCIVHIIVIVYLIKNTLFGYA